MVSCTHRANGPIHMVVQAEHIPASVPLRYLEYLDVQPPEGVRVVVPGIAGRHGGLQQGGEVVGVLPGSGLAQLFSAPKNKKLNAKL